MRRPGPAPLAGWLVGAPVMAYGAWGLLDAAADTHPADATRWIVGAALVHDLVWLPVVLAVAVALSRPLPRRARGPVSGAVAATAVLVAVAWPFARRYGADPANPSLLVRDAATGTAAYVAVVWAVAVAVVVRRRLRGRTGTGPEPE